MRKLSAFRPLIVDDESGHCPTGNHLRHVATSAHPNGARKSRRSPTGYSSEPLAFAYSRAHDKSSLLEKYADQLNRMFTPDVTCQINLMFNGRPGPGLRHQIAHGMVTTTNCYTPDMIYAC
jgi:hypothetical protein